MSPMPWSILIATTFCIVMWNLPISLSSMKTESSLVRCWSIGKLTVPFSVSGLAARSPLTIVLQPREFGKKTGVPKAEWSGTRDFCSIALHELLIDPSVCYYEYKTRDDFESLIYTLMWCITKSLPWDNLDVSVGANRKRELMTNESDWKTKWIQNISTDSTFYPLVPTVTRWRQEVFSPNISRLHIWTLDCGQPHINFCCLVSEPRTTPLPQQYQFECFRRWCWRRDSLVEKLEEQLEHVWCYLEEKVSQKGGESFGFSSCLGFEVENWMEESLWVFQRGSEREKKGWSSWDLRDALRTRRRIKSVLTELA